MEKRKTAFRACPFCGGEAEAREIKPITGGKLWHYAVCTTCRSRTGMYSTAGKAATAWNRRASNG